MQNISKRTIARTNKLQPSTLTFIGLFCVLVYALSRTGFPDAAKVTSTIAGLLGFWGIYKYGKDIKTAPLLSFIILSILLQLIPWVLSHITQPEWAENKLDVDYLTRWLIFIPLAWWVAQYRNGTCFLYLCGALGVLLSPWITGYGTQELIDGIQGKRVDFDLENAQHTSLFFGTVALGLICFFPRILKTNKLLAILTAVLIFYCLTCVLISGSRQSWLALIITLIFALSFFFRKKIKKSEKIKNIKIIFVLIIFSLGVIFSLASNSKVTDRVMKEKDTVIKIISLDFQDVPYTSFGIRFHSWVAATSFIKEKPIFGWGSNGMTLVMKKTDWLPENIKENFGHLHNSYIEIWVNFGVIGLIFYFSALIYFSKNILRYMKEGKIPKDIGYFYFSFLIFWMIMNCFEAYQHYWTGTFCLHIVLSGILAQIWRIKLKKVRHHSVNN